MKVNDELRKKLFEAATEKKATPEGIKLVIPVRSISGEEFAALIMECVEQLQKEKKKNHL